MDKRQILEALLDAANQNGGKPPGMKKFQKVTGVTEAQWLGKYWPKWSDLLGEAGFSAGEMQAALDDETLMKHYLGLVDELGHVPTTPELRVKAYQSQGFPAASTFTRNCSKKRLIGKAIAYCEAHENYRHLLRILSKVPHELHDVEEFPNDTAKGEGYVYLLKFGDDYKIGNSKNVGRRFSEIKTQMPTDGEIVHSIKTGDPEGIESYWHKYFEQKRTKGEWFRLTASDVRYFKKRQLM
ncbi:GIY-YIG nuclease family protein [Shewanella xiamenensis]|uniref:GIY-YIG nuclease family protein n=1 Tax=Shewanella xiamenensis TaxID=332186 RepID=UPI00217D69D6|nr:GIY-YIG nuclease family protein [Shewanella xiamenensis]MCT8861643.1 GIY-YIG nuclease family protein [Shewanella xiamenensis]UWG64201.1 GIY-YIG nuclease family protein [Shewanella xiamenensis]